MTRKKNSGGLIELVRTVVYALLIALAVRTVAFEPFNIPSGSMIPSLLVGDYLFVSKYSYGYSRHSLPFSLPVIPGRIFAGEPERGDVAVFKWPRDNRTDYIKRIVGLPGDRIQVIQGVLHINGTAVARRRIEDHLTRGPLGALRRVPQYIETLPGGVEHRIIEGFGDTGPLDNTGECLVPEGHYFAMGDNRDSSADSRNDGRTAWFVPHENLVGRAEFLFFSTDGSAALWEVWRWPFAIRWGRLFNGVG